MTCVAVPNSPALGACHSPSLRHRDDPTSLFGDLRSTSQLVAGLDLLPPPPLLCSTPKLSPFLSSCSSSSSSKSSPSHSPIPPSWQSPMPLPSPRIKRTSSLTSSIGTPNARSVCLCGGLSICSSCSCTLASTSTSDAKWGPSSAEKRFNIEAHLDGKYGPLCVSSQPPTPSLSSPCSSRYSPAMPPHSIEAPPRYGGTHSIEGPSPRYGGTHSIFTSPSYSRSRANAKISQTDINEHESTANVNDSGISGTRISFAEELLGVDKCEGDRAAAVEALGSNAGPAIVDFSGHSGVPSSPPLKRKRPPKVVIPSGVNLAIPNNMPHVLDLGEEAVNEMTVEGPFYGISCKKGRRETLEDTQRAIPNLHGDPGQAFFGVFDGHGGRKAADFAAENLPLKIMDAMEKSKNGERYLEEAVRSGYLTTDAEFLKKQVSSGASCVTAIMKDGYMVVANAGDCRAVLSRAGIAEALTSDHRAAREDERERIENLGGYVDNYSGTWRVHGILAVSRGIGDLHLKEWISAEPEVKKLRITPDCEFLILASDGLWDTVSNQEAVDTARAVLQSQCVKAEVMDSQIPLAMASSSLSKGVDLVEDEGQCQGKCGIEGKDFDTSLELVSNNDYDTRVPSSNDEDEVGICVGTIDAELPNVGFRDLPLPSTGPVAACRKLVEISVKKGSRDDISVVVVDLQHFQRQSSTCIASESL